MVVSSETEAITPRTIRPIMGFSPKVIVALFALGLVATGSIVFNVYFLTTKDKTLRTEVEGLKDSKGKLELELSASAGFKEQSKVLSDQLVELNEANSDLNNKLEGLKSGKNLLEEENTRLESELRSKIQLGKEERLKSGELEHERGMQKLKDEIIKINKTNEELSERLSTTLVKNEGLESNLTQSENLKNELQTEVTKLQSELRLANQQVEEEDRESVKPKTEAKSLEEQKQSAIMEPQSKLAESEKLNENLKALLNKPLEEQKLPKHDNPEFKSLEKKFMDATIPDVSVAKLELSEFISKHPNILNLPSTSDSAEVERGLFNYFNTMFVDLARNVNSDPDYVAKLRDRASVFADSVLRDFFILSLDDIVVKGTGTEKFNRVRHSVFISSWDAIFSNQNEYLLQRLAYYYQTFYDEPSPANLEKVKNFFKGLEKFKLYELVDSVETMFRRHMESFLILGIFTDNYDATLLASERIDRFSGVSLESADSFKQLLKRHLEPIWNGDNSYFFNMPNFRVVCINFFRHTGEKEKFQPEVKVNQTYFFPILKMPLKYALQTLLDSYEGTFGALPPGIKDLKGIVRLFSSKEYYEKLTKISIPESSPSLVSFNNNLCDFHYYCFEDKKISQEPVDNSVFNPPKELRELFFKILGLSVYKEGGVPLLEQLEKGYLERLIENHLEFLNLKKIPKST